MFLHREAGWKRYAGQEHVHVLYISNCMIISSDGRFEKRSDWHPNEQGTMDGEMESAMETGGGNGDADNRQRPTLFHSIPFCLFSESYATVRTAADIAVLDS